MALKNYTTTINANKTIGEIQEILSKHGATAIMTEYDNGEVVALSFKINTPRGEIGIKLPANTDKVLRVLKKQKQTQPIKNIQRKGGKTMIIEDMQQTLELLENIDYFFKNIDAVERKLQTDLYNKEGERDDLLHEIELSKLNAIERMQTYSRLETVLKERRIIKDKLDLINTIKPYTNKYIMKGICGETNKTIQNIETLKSNQESRQYTPRVIKDLKCAKKKKEE